MLFIMSNWVLSVDGLEFVSMKIDYMGEGIYSRQCSIVKYFLKSYILSTM